MSGQSGPYIQQSFITPDTTTGFVLSPNDSGSVILLGVPAGANRPITLPPLQQGLRFKFITTALPGGANEWRISTNGATNTIVGTVVSAAATATKAAGSTLTQSDVDNNNKVGDYIEMVCSGAFWYTSVVGGGAAAGWS